MFETLNVYDWIDSRCKYYNFDIPDKVLQNDCETNHILITIGRKVVELEYSCEMYNDWPVLIVTFSEQHEGEVVFFYKIGPAFFTYSGVMSVCYLRSST